MAFRVYAKLVLARLEQFQVTNNVRHPIKYPYEPSDNLQELVDTCIAESTHDNIPEELKVIREQGSKTWETMRAPGHYLHCLHKDMIQFAMLTSNMYYQLFRPQLANEIVKASRKLKSDGESFDKNSAKIPEKRLWVNQTQQ